MNGMDIWESFRLFGIYGLFENNHHRSYVVEVYQVPPLRWYGKTDPGSLVLREVFIQLISNEESSGEKQRFTRYCEEKPTLVRCITIDRVRSRPVKLKGL